MYSLKYGALPVARATGGIQEIIEDYDPTTESGYGFLYYDASVEAFWDAIKRARELFYNEPVWTSLDPARHGAELLVGSGGAALRVAVPGLLPQGQRRAA